MQMCTEKGVVWSDGALRRHERYPCLKDARAVKQGNAVHIASRVPFLDQHDRSWSVEIVERIEQTIRAIRFRSRIALASLSSVSPPSGKSCYTTIHHDGVHTFAH
jgi:hypothetical protein